MPNNADVHETRAFVYLKMGEAEVALQEFNASLEIKPDRALSLYGRGLAQVKAGRILDAVKASALALDPAIARQFSAHGLEQDGRELYDCVHVIGPGGRVRPAPFEST